MADGNKIRVEVAYALPGEQKIIALEVERGTTAFDAAKQSDITAIFADLSLDASDMGVFGKTVKPREYVLQAMDRVEIYRPLTIDPKEARKKRAAKAKKKKQ